MKRASGTRRAATAGDRQHRPTRRPKAKAPRRQRSGAARTCVAEEPSARAPRENEVRSTETRLERAPKPSPSDVNRVRTVSGRYVYCIVRSTDPLKFGAIGMDAQSPEVYTINYRDIAAVVSDVPLTPIDSTRENVLVHERVNEAVMGDHTVIPMSFGTVFKTEEDIRELLRSACDAFAEVLDKMQDKFEFGLKVLIDRTEMVRAIEREDEGISRLKAEILAHKGSTYFARMQYGRLIETALQRRAEEYVAEFLRGLRDVSVASRINRAIGDRMIMNAAFLVQRDKEQAFDRRIKEIASRFNHLTVKYTGPWPPYNFISIRLKLERAGNTEVPSPRES